MGGMALQGAVYRPRDAEHTVLHAVIRGHLETFLHEAAKRTDPACPGSLRRSFERSSGAASWRTASRGCGVTAAGWIASCLSRAKGAGSVRAAGAGG